MNFQTAFRDRQLVQQLVAAIDRESVQLDRPVRFMEVCGTHTMAIAEAGLKTLLPEKVQLVSGPGCPVCVTPVDYIDHAVALSRLPGLIITTFGDLLKVPGSRSSLLLERARGADIRTVYSSLDALEIARKNSDREVVFLGVGFETTTPTVAAALQVAEAEKIPNFSLLANHKTMPEAMERLSADPELKIDGYICPAHVSTVIGTDAFRPLADRYGIPSVVTGFEPADLLQGVLMLLKQCRTGVAKVENQYRRAVTASGNRKAQQLVSRFFMSVDAIWRGIGMIPGSGLALRKEFDCFNSASRFQVELPPPCEPVGCRCGEVLTGRISPVQCLLFGAGCTPESPLGACMVSSEGSCAAAWRYGGGK